MTDGELPQHKMCKGCDHYIHACIVNQVTLTRTLYCVVSALIILVTSSTRRSFSGLLLFSGSKMCRKCCRLLVLVCPSVKLLVCIIFGITSFSHKMPLKCVPTLHREREREQIYNFIEINRKHDDTCTNKNYNEGLCGCIQGDLR